MVIFLTSTETGKERLCYKAFLTTDLSSGHLRRRVQLVSLKIKLSSYCNNMNTYLLFHCLCRPIQGTYGQTLDTKPWLIQARTAKLLKRYMYIYVLCCSGKFQYPFFLLLVFTWASVEKPQPENAGHSSWASNGGSWCHSQRARLKRSLGAKWLITAGA